MFTMVQIVWLAWLALAMTLIIATLVTTMADRPKEAFYSVTLLVIVGFSAPILYNMGLISSPLEAKGLKSASMDNLINIVFAAPQIVAAMFLISLYMAMHFLGYTKGSSSSFFIFVKPFYDMGYLDVKVDDMHIRCGSRGDGFKTPIALALAEVVMDQGYKPLYVFGNGASCKVVTKEFTMELATSKKAKAFLDAYVKYKPVKPFTTTLKITQTRIDPASSRLHFFSFGLLGGKARA